KIEPEHPTYLSFFRLFSMTGIPERPDLKLAFGFDFQDLYATEGLERLDAEFVRYLASSNLPLGDALRAARQEPGVRTGKAKSELLIALAPHVERFITELFGIQHELAALRARHDALHPLYEVKRKFVQKRALSRIKPDQAALIDGEAVGRALEKYFGGA